MDKTYDWLFGGGPTISPLKAPLLRNPLTPGP